MSSAAAVWGLASSSSAGGRSSASRTRARASSSSSRPGSSVARVASSWRISSSARASQWCRSSNGRASASCRLGSPTRSASASRRFMAIRPPFAFRAGADDRTGGRQQVGASGAVARDGREWLIAGQVHRIDRVDPCEVEVELSSQQIGEPRCCSDPLHKIGHADILRTSVQARSPRWPGRVGRVSGSTAIRTLRSVTARRATDARTA